MARAITPHEARAPLTNGVKSVVLDGHVADLVIVAARLAGSTGSDGIALFTVHGDRPGLTRTPLPTLDETRKQARLEFANVRAEPLGDPGNDWPGLAKSFDHAAVALACEMVGGAQSVLDMAAEYAKVRVQFGRPIGAFQAVKHKCVDMLLAVETGKSAAYYSAHAAAEDSAELPAVAAVAKAHCAEAYFYCAGENLQIHGGIAFPWEHDAHLYLLPVPTALSPKACHSSLSSLTSGVCLLRLTLVSACQARHGG